MGVRVVAVENNVNLTIRNMVADLAQDLPDPEGIFKALLRLYQEIKKNKKKTPCCECSMRECIDHRLRILEIYKPSSS